MARTKRICSIPLVVTVAAAIAPGCNTGRTEDGQGGDSSTGGVGGAIPECDPEKVSTHRYSGLDCPPGDTCRVTMECTSAIERELMLVCAEDGKAYEPAPGQVGTACENPFEACIGTAVTYDCIDEAWKFTGQGGNPPAPCPEERPAENASCRPGGGFSLDRPFCGYPCSENGGWTIVNCWTRSGEGGTWQSDGACETPGGSNQGGAAGN